MLRTEQVKFYKVKDGQTIYEVAKHFGVSAYKLAKCNGLKAAVFTGQVLEIPQERGDFYTVKEGDTKKLLCGCEENFKEWNGTDIFYIGMRVVINVHKNGAQTHTI